MPLPPLGPPRRIILRKSAETKCLMSHGYIWLNFHENLRRLNA